MECKFYDLHFSSSCKEKECLRISFDWRNLTFQPWKPCIITHCFHEWNFSPVSKKKKNFYTHFTIKLLKKKKKTFSKWPQTNPHFNNILAYIACIGVLVQSNIMLFGRTIDDGCLLHACSWRVDLTGCRYNNLGAIFSVVIAILKIQIYWR